MTKIVYSTQRRDFQPGLVYENPKYFAGVNKNATSVVIIGDWPDVEQAYREAKVPVQHGFGGKINKPEKEAPPSLDTDEDDEDEGNGGDDFASSLSPKWKQSNLKTLRRLVKKLDPDKEVSSRDEAIEFIEAHLEPEE